MASARRAAGAGLIAALLGLGITELTDVAAGVINPLVGQYLVIQGGGGAGGRESLGYPERGENGALAIRVYRPTPGAMYQLHVGVGGRSNGPDGDAGAAMIIEIG